MPQMVVSLKSIKGETQIYFLGISYAHALAKHINLTTCSKIFSKFGTLNLVTLTGQTLGVSVGDKCYTSVTFIDAVVFQSVPVVQAAASQVSYQLYSWSIWNGSRTITAL